MDHIAPSQTAPTQTAAGGARAYIVRPGDTLDLIASRYGVTEDTLVKANNIDNLKSGHIL